MAELCCKFYNFHNAISRHLDVHNYCITWSRNVVYVDDFFFSIFIQGEHQMDTTNKKIIEELQNKMVEKDYQIKSLERANTELWNGMWELQRSYQNIADRGISF